MQRVLGFKDDPDSSDSYDGFQYSIDKSGNIGRAYKVYEDFYPSNNDNGLNKFGSNDVDSDNSVPDKYLQPVQQNGKYGYKNRNGEWIIQPKWNHVTNFEQNIAFVFNEDDSGGKWGLINAKGKDLLKPVCVNVWPFNKGLARCKVRFVNGKYN